MLSSEASVCDAIASPRCTCQHPGGRGDVAAGAGARERGRCTRGARGAGRAPRTAGASASGVPAAAAAAAHLGFGHLLLQRLRRSLEEPRGARAVRVAPEGGGAAKQVVHQRRQVRELLGRAVHGSPYRGHSKARRLQSSRGGGISSGLDTHILLKAHRRVAVFMPKLARSVARTTCICLQTGLFCAASLLRRTTARTRSSTGSSTSYPIHATSLPTRAVLGSNDSTPLTPPEPPPDVSRAGPPSAPTSGSISRSRPRQSQLSSPRSRRASRDDSVALGAARLGPRPAVCGFTGKTSSATPPKVVE